MFILTERETVNQLCRRINRWGITLRYYTGSYVTTGPDQYDWRTVQKSVPFLSEQACFDLVTEQIINVFFDTESEALENFEMIYGDETIPSDDSKIAVNATLINNEGIIQSENT